MHPGETEGNLLVEEVVVDLNLGVGLEVIWHEHDRYLDMAELVYLQKEKEKH